MFKEFTGKTEEEALEKAVAELGIERGKFDAEIIESEKKGLFKKGGVTIRVEVEEVTRKKDTEEKVVEFLDTLISKMNMEGRSKVITSSGGNIEVEISSPDAKALIGREGRTLEAIQTVTRIYAGNLDYSCRVTVDVDGYRIKREENIVREAYRRAEKVRNTGKSWLMNPMNPYERRLVHTVLSEFDDIETKSEGEGQYRQVRIIPRKIAKNR